MHTAPAVPQARPPASVTVTLPSEPGLTVTSHRSRRRSTRFACFTLPPDTDNDWSRNLRKPIEMSSLNAILSLNAVSPSCSWGASTKLAVSTAGAASSTGPATIAAGVLASCRRSPPRVQIAPETAHSRPAASVTVTSPSPSGSTVIRHRSWRRSTRRALVTSPPSTVNESSRIVRKPIPISSLNATRKWNASSPSCASGRPSKLAVSAGSVSGPGPGTMCAGTTDRVLPSDVQTAPSASQSSVGARAIDRSSRLSGVTVISHTPLSPSTRAAPVTAPPATVRTRVRIASGVTATASLNARRKLNAVSPSCASGSPSKLAVSGSATPAEALSSISFQQRTPASSPWLELCSPQPANPQWAIGAGNAPTVRAASPSAHVMSSTQMGSGPSGG